MPLQPPASRAPLPRSLLALLYDLDGVLIDSAPAWFRVLSRAAEQFGVPPVTKAVFVETFGQGMEADRDRFFPGREVADIASFYDQAFPEEMGAVKVAAGALDLLRQARARGLHQAVVTNAPRAVAERILEAKGFATFIDALAAGGDAPEKPAPDLVQAALRKLGVAPGSALYVGDTPSDRAASRAAGVVMAGIGTPADIALGSLADLGPLLGL